MFGEHPLAIDDPLRRIAGRIEAGDRVQRLADGLPLYVMILRRSVLLQRMRQFMRKNGLPPSAAWIVFPMTEQHVIAKRPSVGSDIAVRSISIAVGVNANLAEIVAEAQFHFGARDRIERPAGRLQRRGGAWRRDFFSPVVREKA